MGFTFSYHCYKRSVHPQQINFNDGTNIAVEEVAESNKFDSIFATFADIPAAEFVDLWICGCGSRLGL